MKKLFRITLVDKRGNERIVRTWSKSEEKIREDIKRLLPFLIIKNVVEIKKFLYKRLDK